MENPGLKVLFTRTTAPALQSTTLVDFDSECPREVLNLDECRAKPNPLRVFKNGSRVHFIAYEGGDYKKAASEEYGDIVVEEAQLGTADAWNYFKTRLSQEWGEGVDDEGRPFTSHIESRHLIAVANSGGRNYLYQEFRNDHPDAYYPWKEVHGWFDPWEKVWYPPTREAGEVKTDQDYFAVEWSSRTNYVNLAADYARSLENLPAHLRKRHVEADDAPLEGLIFPEFKRGLHTVAIRGFRPPPHWPIYVGIDYGRKTPTVACWVAVSEEGCFVTFREYRQTMLSPGENGRNILMVNDQLKLNGVQDPKAWWIDQSTDFNRGESETGKTVFKQLVEAGLEGLAKATRDQTARVLRISSLLNPNPLVTKHPITGEIRAEGWPMWIITDDCPGTITEMESWEYQENRSDKKDPTEKPQEKNDHGIDANGYIFVSVDDVAPLDYDTQKLIDNDPRLLLIKEKEDYCKAYMEEQADGEQVASRPDGSVF